jgi:hypothetical protein
MPTSLHRRLRQTAELYNISVSAIVVTILLAFFENASSEAIDTMARVARARMNDQEGLHELED